MIDWRGAVAGQVQVVRGAADPCPVSTVRKWRAGEQRRIDEGGERRPAETRSRPPTRAPPAARFRTATRWAGAGWPGTAGYRPCAPCGYSTSWFPVEHRHLAGGRASGGEAAFLRRRDEIEGASTDDAPAGTSNVKCIHVTLWRRQATGWARPLNFEHLPDGKSGPVGPARPGSIRISRVIGPGRRGWWSAHGTAGATRRWRPRGGDRIRAHSGIHASAATRYEIRMMKRLYCRSLPAPGGAAHSGSLCTTICHLLRVPRRIVGQVSRGALGSGDWQSACRLGDAPPTTAENRHPHVGQDGILRAGFSSGAGGYQPAGPRVPLPNLPHNSRQIPGFGKV